MSAGTALIPNLGAEEPGPWTRHQRNPGVVTTAALWRCLFAAPARVLGVPDPGFESGWPEALGPPPSAAAFDWLDADAEAVAWLPDASAHALARQHDLRLAGCEPALLERLHDKAFALEAAEAEGYCPRPLRGLLRAFAAAELADPSAFTRALADLLAGWPAWTGGRFTLKPRLGTSGRGRLAGSASALDRDVGAAEAIAAALPRFARCGGLILEPWLEREADYAVLFRVAPPGSGSNDPGLRLLGSLEQHTTRSGLCLGHLGEIDSRGRVFSGCADEEAIREAGAALASRAREAGYAGPCGIDAFRFRLQADGEVRSVLRPIVELNARFTLGIVAIGLIRRALAARPAPLGLRPGERRAVLFALDLPRDQTSEHTRAQSEVRPRERSEEQPRDRPDASSPGGPDARPCWTDVCAALPGEVELVSLAPRAPLTPDAARPALLFAHDRDTLRPLLTR